MRVVNLADRLCSFLQMISGYIKKTKTYFVRYGSKQTIRKILCFWKSKQEYQKYQEKVQMEVRNKKQWESFSDWLENTPHDFIDILPTPMGWNTPLFQRYQQISLQIGKQGGIAIYGASSMYDKDVITYKLLSSTLCIANFESEQVRQKIFEAINKRRELKYIRLQSVDMETTLLQVNDYIKCGYHIVYEYIDEISPQIMGDIPQEMIDRHYELLRNEDITVIATSDKLFRQVSQYRNRNMAMLSNGVDYNHWHIDRRNLTPPKDMLPALGKLVVGYHGALAEWLDYDLLKRIAKDGRYHLVLIGQEHDQSLKKSRLLKFENVSFLGSKSFQKLSQYTAFYDVAILPFVINDMTLSVSPVKIFEYMAAGKPIVSSALPECKKYKSCLCAESHDEFMEKLEYAASIRNDAAYLQRLEKDARENTWERVTAKMVEMVKIGPRVNGSRQGEDK